MWIILQPAQNIVLIITLSVGFIVVYLIVIALHYIPIQQGRLVLRAILLKNHYPVLTPTGFTVSRVSGVLQVLSFSNTVPGMLILCRTQTQRETTNDMKTHFPQTELMP